MTKPTVRRLLARAIVLSLLWAAALSAQDSFVVITPEKVTLLVGATQIVVR
jgi:hypothetical protein